MSGSWKGLFGGISSSTEFSIQEINIGTAQGEKKHPKNYFRTNINHQEGLLKKSYSICLVCH